MQPRIDDDAHTAAAASLQRRRVVEGTTAAEARQRVAGLRRRLVGDTDLGGAVDVAERVRRLRERHVEQEQPARTTSQFNAVPAIVRRCRLLDFYVTADRNPGGIRQGMLEEIYVAISVPVKFLIHAPPDS